MNIFKLILLGAMLGVTMNTAAAQQCSSAGALCGNNIDCCSGRCLDSTCAKYADSCRAEGERCSATSDCCAGTCSYQVCTLTPSSGGDQCANNGEGCSSDSQCCSGYCTPYGACQ